MVSLQYLHYKSFNDHFIPLHPNYINSFNYVDASNKPHHLCLVAYYVPDGFQPQPAAHGNCKSEKPFYPTLPSTMIKIKEESINAGPKKVISKVSSELGGVVGASDACILPRNEQQVMKAKSRIKGAKVPTCTSNDEFSIVMHHAFLEDSNDQFIRDVKTLREPAVVACYDRQLDDLVRFCTSDYEFGIMTLDPTFSLGDFDVTVVTYRHLLLHSKRTGRPPVFVGPVLIHYRKTFATYLHFLSTLVGLRRELAGVQCFGSDGEIALIDACKQAFTRGLSLICSIHVRRNITAKMHELRISDGTKKMILDDIFGQSIGSHHTEGLVDAVSESMFNSLLEVMSSKWNMLDSSEEGPLHTFTRWFKRYKCGVIQTSLLRPVREQAGLGCPPEQFTTNASESVNALLKNKVDYKRSELSDFLKKLKEVVNEQNEEVSRAVTGKGKYVIRPGFKKLEKTEAEWFSMKEEIRKQHLRRVALTQVWELNTDELIAFATQQEQSMSASAAGPSSACRSAGKGVCHRLFDPNQSDGKTEMSIQVDSFVDTVTVPRSVLDGIWEKAFELTVDSNAIACAPGYDKGHTVKSSSGKRPHLVTSKKNGQYSCDSDCGNHKSLSICSHSVAVAEIDGELKAFVDWFVKAKKRPNITNLVLTGMPSGRGRKGGVPPRKKKKSISATSRTPASSLLATTSTSTAATTTTAGECSTVLTTPCASGGLPVIPRQVCVPTYPPPLVHYSPNSTESDSPFELCFITGNIKVCRGCRQKYKKPPVPPMDLCVRHQEWQEFMPTGSSSTQVRFGNVYYHVNIPCILTRCPYFSSDMLVIPPAIAMQLLPVHTQLLEEHMHRY